MSSLFPSVSFKAKAVKLQGYQGEQGLKGDQGPKGAQGFTGNTGSQGYQGNTGPTGPRGAQGFIGVGLRGPQGHTGSFNSTDDINTIGTIRGATFVTNYIAARDGYIAGITFQNNNISTDGQITTGLISATTGYISGITFQNNNINTDGQIITGLIGATTGYISGITFQNNNISTTGTITGTTLTTNYIGATSVSSNNVITNNLYSEIGIIGNVSIFDSNISTSGTITGTTLTTNYIGALNGSVGGISLANNNISTNGQIVAGLIGATTGYISGITFQNNNISTDGRIITGLIGATTGYISGITFQNNNISTSGTITGITLTTNYIGALNGSVGGISFANNNISTSGQIITGLIDATTGYISGITFQNNNISTDGQIVAGLIGATTGYISGITFQNNNIETTGTITGTTFITNYVDSLNGFIGGVTLQNSEITGNTFIGALKGTATSAIHLIGGSQYAIPYQTVAGGTTFLSYSDSTGNDATRKFLYANNEGPIWSDDVVTKTTKQDITGKKYFSSDSIPEIAGISNILNYNGTTFSFVPKGYVDNIVKNLGVNPELILALNNFAESDIQNVAFKTGVNNFTNDNTFSKEILYNSNTTYTNPLALVPKKYVDDDTPPPVQFGEPVITSSNIYIPITPPSQEDRGGFPQPYPTILACKFILNGTTIVDSQGTPFDYRYVKPLKTDSNYNYTNQPKGLIISKTQPTSTVPVQKTFYTSPSTNEQRYCIVYNTSSLSTNNTITGYYRNYNAYKDNNAGLISFYNYSSGLPPSEITNVTQGTISATSAQLTITAPTYTSFDSNTGINESTGITITSYQYKYSSNGSNNRYNEPFSFPEQSPSSSSNSSITISSLYPDSSYKFEVRAVNSINLSLSNYAIFLNLFTTLPPTILNENRINSISFTNTISNTTFNTTISCRKVSDNSSVSVYNNITSLKISTTTNFSLNYDNTLRGKSGVNKNLMILSATLQGTSSTVSKDFTGFSLPLPSSGNTLSSDSKLTLNYGSVTDQYSSSANQNKGFYLQLNGFDVVINSNGLTAQQDLQTLNIKQEYYDLSGNLISNSFTKPITYYYDNLSSVPTINSGTTASINNANSSMTFISGINILKSNPQFIITTNVSNLYNYFYMATPITYTITDGATLTSNETNITTNKNSTTADGSQITFTNTGVIPTVATTYKNQVTISITARNLIGNSSTTQITISVICDTPSYNLLFSSGTTLRTSSIQDVNSTTAKSGYRIWSGPAATFSSANETYSTYIPVDYGYNSNANSYSTIQYKHNWNICSQTNSNTGTLVSSSIDASQELIVANGAYRNQTTSSSYYINYDSFYTTNTNPNYSQSSAPRYRFATFAWKYIGDNLSNIQKFVFTFKNFIPSSGLNNNTANGAYYFDSDPRFLLHYRIEDTTSGTQIVPSTNSKYSTLWIDGNSKYGTSVTSGTSVTEMDTGSSSVSSSNYYSTDSKTLAPTSISYSSGADLVATLSNINFGPAATKFNIYCRIGLPCSIATNYSFTDVQLNFTY